MIAGGIYIGSQSGHLEQFTAVSNTEPEVPLYSDSFIHSADNFIELNENSNFFAARYKLCRSNPEDFLCDLFKDNKASSAQHSKNTKYLPTLKINQLARKNKLNSIEFTTLRNSIKAVGALGNKQRDQISQKLLKDQTLCASPNFIAALAFKTEEKFPKKSAIDLALNLYKKANECATSEHNNDFPLFRGGLIALWQNDLTTAEQYFQQLEKSQDVSFSARANFWLAQIKKHSGEDLDHSDLEKDFSSFPLSFHTLVDYVSSENGPFEIVSELKDQKLVKRSNDDYTNHIIQYTEYFISKEKKHLAKKVLEFAEIRRLEQAEPGALLYLAEFIAQFDDLNHQRFMLMSKLFQKHPEYKTLKNLQIFYPLLYEDLIVKHKRDQDPFLIMALMRQESSFNPNTRSPVGATGLMQIMPRTARDIKKREVTIRELLDPQKNIEMGANYFSRLMREHKQDPMKALASYNAGSGNVRKWTKRYPVEHPLLFVDLIPFDETREYVAGILRNQYWYSKLYANVIESDDSLKKTEIAGPISASKTSN